MASSLDAQQDSTRLEDLMKKDIFKKSKPAPKEPVTKPAPAEKELPVDNLLPPAKSGVVEPTDKSDFDARATDEAIPDIPKVPEIPDMPNANLKPSRNSSPTRIALQRDQFNKRVVPITMSRKDRVQKRRKPLNMLPENASVTGRLGKLRKASDGWYVVDYVSSPELRPLASQRLLPCRNLQSAVDIFKKDPNTVFGIYGQATTFNNTPYLMLRRITLPDDTEKTSSSLDLDIGEDKENSQEAAAVSDKPANEGGETGSIISELLDENQGAGVTTAFAPKHSAKENIKSVAPAGKAPLSRGREHLVIDRIARIIKPADSKWFEAHFESDNTLREPPYFILPNSKLGEAIRINSKLGRSNTKFRISGEVTYFQGKRYLLITKVFVQRNMRQF